MRNIGFICKIDHLVWGGRRDAFEFAYKNNFHLIYSELFLLDGREMDEGDAEKFYILNMAGKLLTPKGAHNLMHKEEERYVDIGFSEGFQHRVYYEELYMFEGEDEPEIYKHVHEFRFEIRREDEDGCDVVEKEFFTLDELRLKNRVVRNGRISVFKEDIEVAFIVDENNEIRKIEMSYFDDEDETEDVYGYLYGVIRRMSQLGGENREVWLYEEKSDIFPAKTFGIEDENILKATSKASTMSIYKLFLKKYETSKDVFLSETRKDLETIEVLRISGQAEEEEGQD